MISTYVKCEKDSPSFEKHPPIYRISTATALTNM